MQYYGGYDYDLLCCAPRLRSDGDARTHRRTCKVSVQSHRQTHARRGTALRMVIGDLKADWPASRQLRLHAPRHVHSSRASAVGFATAVPGRISCWLVSSIVVQQSRHVQDARCRRPSPRTYVPAGVRRACRFFELLLRRCPS